MGDSTQISNVVGQLQIVNAPGQIGLTKQNKNSNVIIDMGHLLPGLYMVNVQGIAKNNAISFIKK